jgi:hypothetical protein
MSGHRRLVPGDYLDATEVRAGYMEAKRAIELGAMVRRLRLDVGLSQEELARRAVPASRPGSPQSSRASLPVLIAAPKG